jgi:hypothetical protein
VRPSTARVTKPVSSSTFTCLVIAGLDTLVRGELWEALEGLHSIRSLAFVPLLDWAAERPHEGYRRLEGKLDSQTASHLKDTLSPLEPAALHAALRAEVELFRDLRAEVFGRHGLGFDPAPEEMMEAEMDRRWTAREGP